MKIAFISNSNYKGGADLSALKIFKLLKKGKINIKFLIRFSKTNNRNQILIGNYYLNLFRSLIFLPLKNILKEKDFSLNIFPSRVIPILKKERFDLINFHWLGSETISINEIKKIKQPIVFTLHDQWLYNGGEHYFNFEKKNRSSLFIFINKYLKSLKSDIFKKNNIFFVCPSRWMKKELKKKINITDDRIATIPYPINRKIFRPASKAINKNFFNISTKKKIGLFITATNINDKRKGFDLLKISLDNLKKNYFELLLVGSKIQTLNLKQKFYSKNFINSETQVSKLINCSDFLLFPSRADNLPNVVLESLSCNKPIVAFDVGGLRDVIKHGFNGYLAKPFDTQDFCKGIDFVLANTKKLSKNISSDHSFKKFVEQKYILEKYIKFFNKINYINDNNKS